MIEANLTPEQLDPSYKHFPSSVVEPEGMEWQPTKYPGIDIKVLLNNPETGLLTALFRWAPGSVLPLHEHVEIEQTYVLEGAFEDDEGEITAGNYVSRPAGSRHVARSPKGAIILSMFLKPNIFFKANGEKETFSSTGE
jgi:anti-sigma factor ChrR (cupin superfamily)